MRVRNPVMYIAPFGRFSFVFMNRKRLSADKYVVVVVVMVVVVVAW